jgi:hypothetical protein
MELSTPFLHLKFNPLTMQFVSEPNKIDSSVNNNLTIGYQNYNCNENQKAALNFDNEEINSPYQTSNSKLMKSNFFTFIASVVVACLFTTNANAQTGSNNIGFAGKGNLTEDSLNTFISFSPVHLDGKTYVRWLVKNDKKDGIFVVERSEDGTDFEALGFRDRVGTELTVNLFYSFVDEEPLAGTSLYRVMQVGADNTYKYSSVVKVKNEKNPNRGTSSAIETSPTK